MDTPEVAVHDLAHVEEVLLPQRPIEAQPRADLGDLLGRGPLAEHGERRVAGNQVDEAEDEEGHADEHGDHGQAVRRIA